MAEDDRALREKLAALEAEVKADADAQRARKEAALAKVREQRAAEQPEDRQVRADGALAKSRAKDEPRRRKSPEADHTEGIGGALELATRANQMKSELVRKPGKGEKSWIKSGIASMALGPIGWLYAGSMREAIPASAAWLVLAAIASKIIPMFLLMPVLMVVLPLSGIAGVVYALQYNRHGGRQRLFEGDDKKDDKKQLKSG